MSVCYEDAICTLSDSCSICLLTWMGVTWTILTETSSVCHTVVTGEEFICMMAKQNLHISLNIIIPDHREASEVTDLLLKSCAWSKVSQRHHQSSYWWTYLKWWPSQLAVNWLDSELKPILLWFQQKQVDMGHRLSGQLTNSWNNDQMLLIDYSNIAITAYGQFNLQISNNLLTINI